jgi:hypothetical protein
MAVLLVASKVIGTAAASGIAMVVEKADLKVHEWVAVLEHV